MTTASVRDLRNSFPRIRKRLKKGEEVGITFRGKLICKLVPLEPKDPEAMPWPDISERLKAIYGDQIFENPVLKMRELERW